MKTPSLKTQLDAAGRAHIMAMQRGDHAEVDRQFKRIRRLLKQAARDPYCAEHQVHHGEQASKGLPCVVRKRARV